MLFLTILGWIFVFYYAPAATRKQPIKHSRKRALKIKSLSLMTLYFILFLFVPEPFNHLIAFGAFYNQQHYYLYFFLRRSKNGYFRNTF